MIINSRRRFRIVLSEQISGQTGDPFEALARGGLYQYFRAVYNTASSPVTPLPDYLQRKLNFAGWGLRGSDQPGAGRAVAILIEDGPIIVGRSEVGAVEDIEEFRPELDIEIFRDLPDTVVLEQREIQV
jgi:hypothetical protein